MIEKRKRLVIGFICCAIFLLVPALIFLSFQVMHTPPHHTHVLEPPSKAEEPRQPTVPPETSSSHLCIKEAETVVEALWRFTGVKVADVLPQRGTAKAFRELSMKALRAEWRTESKPAIDAEGRYVPALRRRMGLPVVKPCSEDEPCQGCPSGTFEIVTLPP